MGDGLTAASELPERTYQWTALFDCIPFKVSIQDDSIVKDIIDAFAGTVNVVGAALGDFVLVAAELDNADLELFATVTAADTVTLTLSNNTGGTLTTFVTTARVVNGLVLKPVGPFREIT